MEKKQRLFIYDRKEIAVLILLGAMVAVFAFTLGIHLGKKVGPKVVHTGQADALPVATVHDSEPSRAEVTEQSREAAHAGDDVMNKSLHDEVQATGIRMETPVAVELPKEPRSRNAGATNPRPAAGQPPSTSAPETGARDRHAAEESRAAPHASATSPKAERASAAKPASQAHAESPAPSRGARRFTLQVGSYQTVAEARSLREKLEAFGLKPYVRSADLGARGTWHRVFVGTFSSKEEADQMGSRYQAKKMIESFVVARNAE